MAGLSLCFLISISGMAQEQPPAPNTPQKPSATAAMTPVRVEFSELKVRHRPQPPAYPPLARMTNLQGTVVLKFALSQQGSVEQVSVVEGPAQLVPAAETFLKRWTFEPVQRGGEPVRAECLFRMPFRLSDAPAEAAVRLQGAVIQVEQARGMRSVSLDLPALRAEAHRWLARCGMEETGVPGADPARTLHVKVEIESLRSEDGVLVCDIRNRCSLLSDSDLQANETGKHLRVIYSQRIVGQKGEAGFQDLVTQCLGRALGEFLVGPDPRPSPVPPVASQNHSLSPKEPDAPPPAGSKIVDFDFSQVKIRKQPPAPAYPTLAKARRIQGTVMLDLTIDPRGHTISAEAVAGPPELEAYALRWSLQWEFEPARLNGIPQYAKFHLTMPFRLH